MIKPGIILDKVSFSYDNKNKEINDISLEITKGRFVGITGVNGSGKTTFTYLLNGLIPHQILGNFTGNVYVDGINTRSKPVSFFAHSVGIVFQNPDFMIFNLTVYDEIAFALQNLAIKNIEEKVKKSLKIVGLEDFAKKDPHTLSLGQKQKMCLAVILAMDTDYIVLDEPSAMLDYKSTLHLYEILKFLNENGKTVIIVEHDTDFLYRYAQQLVVLDRGKIILQGDVNKVFSEENKLNKLGIKIPRKI